MSDCVEAQPVSRCSLLAARYGPETCLKTSVLPSLADQSILLEKSFATDGEKKSRSQRFRDRFSQTDSYAQIDFMATTLGSGIADMVPPMLTTTEAQKALPHVCCEAEYIVACWFYGLCNGVRQRRARQ